MCSRSIDQWVPLGAAGLADGGIWDLSETEICPPVGRGHRAVGPASIVIRDLAVAVRTPHDSASGTLAAGCMPCCSVLWPAACRLPGLGTNRNRPCDGRGRETMADSHIVCVTTLLLLLLL